MSLVNEAGPEALTEKRAARARGEVPEGVTVDLGGLASVQRIHAVAIAVVPALGTALAIWLAVVQGVSALDLGLLVFFYVFTMFGIGVGFHRLFSHRSFKAAPSVRVAFAIAGSMAAQGPLIYWVANHRRHHQFSDRPGDTHSPYFNETGQLGFWRGLWHAHMGWTFEPKMTNVLFFAKDLYRDPLIQRMNALYYVWLVLGLAIPALIGGLWTMSLMGALTGFLWGGLVRMFLVYHVVNGVDSIVHMFGTQPFECDDESRNNVPFVVASLGEGWHHNHHVFPTSAELNFDWWQLDPSQWLIRGLAALGLVWDIQRPTPGMIEAKRRRSA